MKTSAARRYARALLAVGVEDQKFEQYADELEKVASTYTQSTELQDIWSNPAYSKSQQLGVIEILTKNLSLSPAITNTVKLLVQHQRAEELELLRRVYRDLSDEQAQKVRATITTAVELDAQTIQSIEAGLAKALQKKVIVTTQVDASILGGVVTQVDGRIFDGSIKSQLNTLREQLLNAPLSK